jgi:hypothetical protein
MVYELQQKQNKKTIGKPSSLIVVISQPTRHLKAAIQSDLTYMDTSVPDETAVQVRKLDR